MTLRADLVAARCAARATGQARALLVATGDAGPADRAARLLAFGVPGDCYFDVVVGPQYDPGHVAKLSRLAIARA